MVQSFVNRTLGLNFCTQTSQSLLFPELITRALLSEEESITLTPSTSFPLLRYLWVKDQSLWTSKGPVGPGQMDLIRVKEGAVWALPTINSPPVLRDCGGCVQGMEIRRAMPEPSLLGDVKLIQMNQRGFCSSIQQVLSLS